MSNLWLYTTYIISVIRLISNLFRFGCYLWTSYNTKEKVQKDKQLSTKHTYKTKDRVTRTPLKTGDELGAPEGQAVPAPLVAPVVLI